MKTILITLCVLMFGLSHAQHRILIQVKDLEKQAPMAGSTIELTPGQQTTLTNQQGIAEFTGISDTVIHILVKHSGFEAVNMNASFPISDTLIVWLETSHEEMEEVVVRSTRTSRSIRNTPTRVELIDEEEVDEKNNMRPANIAMLLHESTGIQVQQTSATSASASFRVQGLDGRYTQLLKDGYPSFGNFASGLSVLEIPPLDLKQVEVIKGPASTLYGGGAIAGVINFISKDPGGEPEHLLLINQSNIGQTNLGGFSSGRFKKFGYTVMGLINSQKAYDVDKDMFSELPRSNGMTWNTKLFFYPSPGNRIMLGHSFNRGRMTGGDMMVIDGMSDSSHVYFEKNTTTRNTTTLEWENKKSEKKTWLVKQSLSLFDRSISIPGYQFSGSNLNTFSEVCYTWKQSAHTLVSGMNIVYDQFRQDRSDSLNARTFTTGWYMQHTWDITAKLKLENGIRADYVSYTGKQLDGSRLFLLPRISALLILNNHVSSRISGGLGYKAPSIFNEQTESFQYRNLRPLQQVRPEQSIGGTFDLNYRQRLGESLSLSLNQLFFFTKISSPLVLQNNSNGLDFSNKSRPVLTRGFETNLKIIYSDNLKLFAGFTYVDAKATYLQGITRLSLLPKGKVNLALIYEKEKSVKLGFEAYHTGRQLLSDKSMTPAFWELGFMAEKTFKKRYSFYINFENFTDTRQSRFKRVVNGTATDPMFDEIWTHTEGFTFNAGVKIRL